MLLLLSALPYYDANVGANEQNCLWRAFEDGVFPLSNAIVWPTSTTNAQSWYVAFALMFDLIFSTVSF